MPLAAAPSRNLQESLLAVLIFKRQHAPKVRARLSDLKLWDEPYRDVVRLVYRYLDKYKKPPEDHMDDLLEDLPGDEDRRAAAFQLVRRLGRIRDTVNAEYAVTRLNTFLRRQTLNAVIRDIVPLLTTNEPDLDDISARLQSAIKSKPFEFNKGVTPADFEALRQAFNTGGSDVLPTGIEALDDLRAGPARKELHLLIGGAGHGKTWWLTHLARHAARRGHRVLHITLEVSEQIMLQRYAQAFFSLSQRNMEQAERAKFKISTDSHGRAEITDISMVPARAAIEGQDEAFDAKWQRQQRKFRGSLQRIRIKEYPSGGLTMRELLVFMDVLVEEDEYTPDLLVLDYPDLMKMGGSLDNRRIALGQLFVELRGLAGERNMAVAVVTQGNRKFVESESPTETMVAEDWSKIATADTVLIQQKKELEGALGLARLYLAKNRNGPDKRTIAITQNLACGQFCTQAVPVPFSYYRETLLASDVAKSRGKGPRMKDDERGLAAAI